MYKNTQTVSVIALGGQFSQVLSKEKCENKQWVEFQALKQAKDVKNMMGLAASYDEICPAVYSRTFS